MTTKDNPQQSSHRGGSGNFADDPKRASEAGQKGGQHSGGQHTGGSTDHARASDTDKKSGQSSGGNFAQDHERASEVGKKGGQHSHDNKK